MNKEARQQRNAERLQQLHPGFRLRVHTMLTALEAAGWHPRCQDAWRSPEQQLRAWRNGYSKLKFGFHNVTDADGNPAALAVDVLDDDAPESASPVFLLQLAAAAEQAGLRTGIRWGLPRALAQAIDRAVAASDWHAAVKLGWDPGHVETSDVTVAQARAGRRPSGPDQVEKT
ncbi:hypothetical protein QN362_14025 [Actimicrobium sp. CCC2.4]|uniref:hypothetical protein n=1 Tax=Actimicrobium sp. CCC2.4 TaxID=3048606 RepID=UPI002AC928DE|nr:hypothetical protein [Actimicrobium sp. CCC2.4]MEB0136454.1 hypothetical protein [Actimicrobium sp. CCC2.4]WPX30815.1 hypothetical protein RHM62_11115 [Actimicrobium sp. CCC2.4]